MFDPGIRKIPWRRKWHSTSVLLPGKSHRLRSLVGYSPWGRKESDMTEQLHFTSYIYIMHACMYSCFSHIHLFEGAHRTLCTVAHQSLLSMVFSRQEYWSRLCHALLQGIFTTQGSNLGFLLWRWILYCSVTREDLILCIHTTIYINIV